MILRTVRVYCLAVVLAAISPGVLAQQADQPGLLDAEQAFQIAKKASAAGDFQSAIIALERILVISPELANIQFELGLLYKRVGAPRRAEYFFRESLKSDEMPPEIRQRAETELAQLSTIQNTGTFSVNLGLRLRQETNPGSFSKEADFFDGFSQSFVTGTSIGSEDADGSAQFNLGTNYRRRFGDSARHQWLAGARFNSSNYFNETEFDESSLTVNANTLFALTSSSPSFDDRAGPFVYYTLGFDGSSTEDAIVGGGLRFSKTSRNWSTSASLEANSKTYEDSAVAQNRDENGTRLGLSFRFRPTAFGRTTYGIATNFSKVNSATDFNSYTGSTLVLSASYPINLFENAPRSSVTFSGGVGDREYESLNLAVSDTNIREDDRPQLGVALNIPFSNGFGINAGVRVQDSRSNLPNYRYRNTTTHVGISWRN